MKNGNPIYKLLFKYHVNMIEVCNIRQCLGLISDDWTYVNTLDKKS